MYVVYNRSLDGTDGRYWNGTFRANGDPGSSDVIDGAVIFPTAREAYETAGKYPCLEGWRVGRRAGA